MTEIEICKKCSGAKYIKYDTPPQGPIDHLALIPEGMKICHCLFKPEHTGDLDTYGISTHASVKIQLEEEEKLSTIWIHGGFGDIEERDIYLGGAQFLSLIEWGEQHRAFIEHLKQIEGT